MAAVLGLDQPGARHDRRDDYTHRACRTQHLAAALVTATVKRLADDGDADACCTTGYFDTSDWDVVTDTVIDRHVSPPTNAYDDDATGASSEPVW